MRLRRHLTQQALSELAGVGHSTVSLVERGHGGQLSIDTVRRIAAPLDIRVDVVPRWRGGDLARLLSRRHSALAESFAHFLESQPGWVVEPEVSFSIYGERGVIDQLAWHAESAHLLVIELKTQFVDINEMLGTLDRKQRLAMAVAAERGMRPRLLSVWLVVSNTRTNHRHAAEHATLLRSRFKLDGRGFRQFLRNPIQPTTGLAFWTDSNPGGASPRRQRV